MGDEQVGALDATSRARFLGGAAALAGLAAASGGIASKARAAQAPRSYVSGHFALVLDGVNAGFVRSVDGGAISAEVISTPGSGSFAEKSLGQLRYEALYLDVGAGMTPGLFSWVSDSWRGKGGTKNAKIVTADHNYKALREREFKTAAILATKFPTLEAGSKEPAVLELKLLATEILERAASGNVTAVSSKAKAWLPGNFRFTLGKMTTSHVSKIESFTVKQGYDADWYTPSRDDGGEVIGGPYEIVIPVDVPPLTVHFAEGTPTATSFQQWFDDFVIAGNNGPSRELTGKIELLSPNLLDTLLEVTLTGVGISRLSPAMRSASSEAIARMSAELYVEKMEFKVF